MITFRPLEEKDYKLMHTWLNTEHVLKWWDKAPSYDDVVKKYSPRIKGDTKIHVFIMQNDGLDFGMVQYYLEDDKEYELDDKACAIDLFIGEVDMLYKGVGTKAIKACIKDLIIPHYNPTYICIDPDDTNEAAIKAYKKVGFTLVQIGLCRDCGTHNTAYMKMKVK